jgi:hypothetical protein
MNNTRLALTFVIILAVIGVISFVFGCIQLVYGLIGGIGFTFLGVLIKYVTFVLGVKFGFIERI